MDRTKYVVPNNKLHDFIKLWLIENARVPNMTQKKMNQELQDIVFINESYDIVSDKPEMPALDTIFKELADKRHDKYTYQLIKNLAQADTKNWGIPFSDGTKNVRLGQGWYTPEQLSNGSQAWWTGPESGSIVAVSKSLESCFLTFKAFVFCGTSRNELYISSASNEELSAYRKEGDIGHVTCAVYLKKDITSLQLDLTIPMSPAPGLVNPTSSDYKRRGIAVAEFKISNNLDLSDNLLHTPHVTQKKYTCHW